MTLPEDQAEAPETGPLPDDHTEVPQTGPPLDAPIVTWKEIIAGLVLFVGSLAVIGAVLAFRGDTGDDVPSIVQASGSGTPVPTGVTGAPTTEGSADGSQQFVIPQNGDEQAVENLARQSVILLPAGRWPQLYDDFTPEFQARCTPEEFAQGGVDSANELGDRLELIGFLGLETITITGDTATAIIVGEVQGESQYKIEANFAKVDGSWKIAPVPDTEGCSAFNRL